MTSTPEPRAGPPPTTSGSSSTRRQVIRVAIEVAGFSPAKSDGFRRAMGTWRSTREMEKPHRPLRSTAALKSTRHGRGHRGGELFRQVSKFRNRGFAKRVTLTAFAQTAYRRRSSSCSARPGFLAGLINAQPMSFTCPVEVLVNDAKRHGVAVPAGQVNTSAYLTTPGMGLGRSRALPPGAGIRRSARRARPLAGLSHPVGRFPRDAGRPTALAAGGVRLRLSLVKGIGEKHAERLDAGLASRSMPEPVKRRRRPGEPAGGHRAAHPGGRPGHAGAAPAPGSCGGSAAGSRARAGGRIDGRTKRTAT